MRPYVELHFGRRLSLLDKSKNLDECRIVDVWKLIGLPGEYLKRCSVIYAKLLRMDGLVKRDNDNLKKN